MTARHRHLRTLAFALACGCGPPPPPPNQVADATAPAPVPVQAATASAASAKSLPPLPSAVSKARVPDDAPRFAVVAQGADGGAAPVSLLRTGDGQVFAASGPWLMRLASDGSFTQERAWTRGVDTGEDEYEMTFGADLTWWVASAMGGSWPEGAYLVLTWGAGTRLGDVSSVLYRRVGEAWTRVATDKGKLRWYPRRFGPWKDGSILALKGFDLIHPRSESGPPPAVERAFKAAVAAEKKLIVLRGAPQAPKFGERDVQAFASLATGEIVALIADRTGMVALHYTDSGAGERTLALPDVDRGRLTEVDVRLSGPDRAWMSGEWTAAKPDAQDRVESRGYLARFDGQAWTEVATECRTAVRSLSLDDRGVPYFVCAVKVDGDRQRSVLFRVRDDVVEELPTEFEPDQVLARGPADIWVLAQGLAGPTKLLHSGTTRGEPAVLPSSQQVAAAAYEWAGPRPVDAACRTLWLPAVAGRDVQALESMLEGFGGDEIRAEAIQGRVHGRVEVGVMLRVRRANQQKRALQELQKRLDDAVGAPTCDERLSVETAPGP